MDFPAKTNKDSVNRQQFIFFLQKKLFNGKLLKIKNVISRANNQLITFSA